MSSFAIVSLPVTGCGACWASYDLAEYAALERGTSPPPPPHTECRRCECGEDLYLAPGDHEPAYAAVEDYAQLWPGSPRLLFPLRTYTAADGSLRARNDAADVLLVARSRSAPPDLVRRDRDAGGNERLDMLPKGQPAPKGHHLWSDVEAAPPRSRESIELAAAAAPPATRAALMLDDLLRELEKEGAS